jgi:hypothetical protein
MISWPNAATASVVVLTCLAACSAIAQTVGKMVRHGRHVRLKVAAAMLNMFSSIRERCARVMREGGVVPETS